MFGDVEIVAWECSEPVRSMGDERLDPSLGPCPVLAGIERCHEQLRWARVQARWKAKGRIRFVDWRSGPEVMCFSRIPNIDEVTTNPVTIKQMRDLWWELLLRGGGD